MLLSFTCLGYLTSTSQNLICKSVTGSQTILLDTLAIEPGSVSSASTFTYDEETQLLTLSSPSDSTEVCYRVIASALSKPFQLRDISTYDDSSRDQIVTRRKPVDKEELFDFGGVQKYGAITRGVSFGNRQSVFVNSSLNLQMEGKLAENLHVSAVITDQNIPYQPEGNTQQIRDFDNVFIKLYNDNFEVTAGDIVLQNEVDSDYFLRYYKNVQGLQLSYQGESNGLRHSSRVSGAVAKGKFSSALIPAVEGLSGPYRLRGPNGERFIIVLANSEKVFLDGKLLERGFDRDYIIDYNLGEFTFNNHIVITQFSRIRVDFEYAEQFYSRSNFSAMQTLENDRVKLYGGFYRERDNPNNNLNFTLNETDLVQLQGIGDQLDQAFITGFDSVMFDSNRILYEQIDTVDLDGLPQRIFVFSTDSEQELFAATFSEVGFGNGDYVLQGSTSNGRIYEWVSRQNGERQGNYQPGAAIPLPNSRQMVNVGTEVKLNDYETVFSEVAFSNTDLNLYSSLDDQDNNGLGYYGGIRSSGRNSFLNGYVWSGSISTEFDQRDFTFVDRYRAIEFDRNWDLNLNGAAKSTDLLLFAKSSFYKDRNNEITYSLNRRKREELINGWQQSLVFNQSAGSVRLKSNHFYLTSDQAGGNSSEWLQSSSDLSLNKFPVVPGYIFRIDENTLSEADSVLSTRMHFRSHEFYLTSGDSTASNYRVSYTIRNDKLPVNGDVTEFLESKNLNANYTLSGSKQRLSADFNYRSVNDRLGLNEGQNEIVNGRVNWRGNFVKRHIIQNFSFSTGNSRELRREFVYLPVPTGEGTHTWRDQNEDGIQDLNEFFEAINPDERNFAKIFTPTDEYISAFQTFYIHSLDLKMPISWRRQGGMKALLGKISLNANFNINFKTTSQDYSDRLNPFSVRLAEESLLAAQDSKRYTLFFNRNGRGFAGDFAFQTSDNKQLLTQGFELRERQEWVSNFKIDLTDEYTFRMSSSFGEFLNQSDFLDSRNFEIISDSYEPQLIWQPIKSLRLIGSYERENRKNRLLETSTESSLIQSYKGELTWNQVGKGSLRGSFRWVKIDFEGDPMTYLAYLLLDALQPGTNQTWELNWQQKLSKGMQLSLLYNGRKSETSQPIHTGSVQVTAFF